MDPNPRFPVVRTEPLPPQLLRALSLLLALLFSLLSAPQLRADTLSGTVKDPSGAVVANAHIEITGGNLAQPLVLASDAAGKFTAPNLAPGKYSILVIKDGFDDLTLSVDLTGRLDVPLNLTITAQQTTVTVSANNSAFANSDPVYRQLRSLTPVEAFHCENFTLPMDVGAFTFKSGTFSLLGLVDKSQTGAVFIGQGHFSLKPLAKIDANELLRRSGAPVLEEDFSEVVFRFTPDQFAVFAKALGAKVPVPPEALTAFARWQEKIRRTHEVPDGYTQSLLEGESIDNVDADLLSAIYNPKHPPFFNAYIHGASHKDLRFFVRARVGAIPQLDSPEEVALINCNGAESDDGIWYSQHLGNELMNHTASSLQDRRIFATRAYNIETVIAKNNHLFSRATITFEALLPGERVMKFALLPTLRVSRVSGPSGQDIHFIQESRRQDGSFYAVLDEPAPVGQPQSITVEYSGDQVVYNAGSGSYYIGARTSWYPNLNGFGEKTLYDLTFKVPPHNVLISVGKLTDQRTEAGFAVTHWVTPQPVAIAGFNYGQYKKVDLKDDITHYEISGYYLQDLPDSLRAFQGGAARAGASNGDLRGLALNSLSPGSMTKYALDQTRAQMQICTFYFGRAPFENINITEQPNFNFGQSWPSLVYLPISAYIDSTQRWMMFGAIDRNFNGFVQEVTPHEVAHQWFGHSTVWASYHDEWLSEGFAEFAAGLFLEQGVGPKWQKDYIDFWDRLRTHILDKNNYGMSPNDAGPLWLGLRLISPHSPNAYQGVTYAKGAYILSMLRSLLHSPPGAPGNPDQTFIDMMHDFTETYRDKPASTESFEDIAAKHITPELDLQKNGRLDWFFREWVMGTLIPRYTFKYQVQPAESGHVRVHVELAQSEVDQNFAMFVPVFADFGNGMVRLGQLAMVGNSTRQANFLLDRQPQKVAINAYKEILER
jgi:hypothetical protein